MSRNRVSGLSQQGGHEMEYEVIIESSIVYQRTIEARSPEEAQEQAEAYLKSGAFVDWRITGGNSQIYDIWGG